MPFLIFNNANIQFAKKKLTWRSYTTEEALPITCQVELIDKKKFAKAALDENVKAFMVYVAFFTSKISIHSAREAQIALLLAKKVIIPFEYSDYVDVRSKESVKVLP